MNEKHRKTLIHIAKYFPPNSSPRHLFLREVGPDNYTWREEIGGEEKDTDIQASSIEEALRLAHKKWKNQAFRTVICGFTYALPERDEHGVNALFHQMVASYSTPNGVYFDKDLGHNRKVDHASREALDLWKELEKSGRL